jgi:hypothetical protein
LTKKGKKYKRWLESGYLTSPIKRLHTGEDLIELIRGNLEPSLENAQKWAGYIKHDFQYKDRLLRYSAEMATILALSHYSKTNEPKAFLTQYDEILLLADPNDYTSLTVAKHLCEYLRVISPNATIIIKEFKGLSTPLKYDVFNNKKGLVAVDSFIQKYLNNRNPVLIDIIISGGYKLFSLYFAKFWIYSNVRLIYWHESYGNPEDLVILQGNNYSLPEKEKDFSITFEKREPAIDDKIG